MGLESIQVSAVLPADPVRIFNAWMSSKEHTAFTGGRAEIEAAIGGRHTAWDGYIEGRTVVLEPGRRIVQTWRSEDFPPEHKDSRLEVVLEAAADGTKVTLLHTEIPEGQGRLYEQGWIDHYFKPMTAYFTEGDDEGEMDEDNEPGDAGELDDEGLPPPPMDAPPMPRLDDLEDDLGDIEDEELPPAAPPMDEAPHHDEEPAEAPREAPAEKAAPKAKKPPAKKPPAKKPAPKAKKAPAKKPAAKKPAKKPAKKKPAKKPAKKATKAKKAAKAKPAKKKPAKKGKR